MTGTGVVGIGTYVPRNRISASAFDDAGVEFLAAGVREKSVPDVDEDALTMAYEAGRLALDAAEYDGSDIESLVFATTNPPLTVADVTVDLGAMLGVDSTTSRKLYSASTCAGVQALLDGLRLNEEGLPALVVTADRPMGTPSSGHEHGAGAGAVAFTINTNGAVRCRDSKSHAESYPGIRFREPDTETTRDLGLTQYERIAFERCLEGALSGIVDGPDTVNAVALQAYDGKRPYRLAKSVGLESKAIRRYTPVHEIGNLGAASVPMSLTRAFEDSAEEVLAVGLGSGAIALAISLERCRPVPIETNVVSKRYLTYSEYLAVRGRVAFDEPSGGGAYVSVPVWRRTQRHRFGLIAGRCPTCGSLNSRPEGACQACHESVEYEPVPLARTGTVEGVTTIEGAGAPPEFAELQSRTGPYTTAIVAFDGPDDDTAALPCFVVSTGDGSLEIGDRVEATIRRIYTQEGVTRYGFKVSTIEGASQNGY